MTDERIQLTDMIDDALKPFYALETRDVNDFAKRMGLAAGMVATTPLSLVGLISTAFTYPLHKAFSTPVPLDDDWDLDSIPELVSLPFFASLYVAYLPIAFGRDLFSNLKTDHLKFTRLSQEQKFPKLYSLSEYPSLTPYGIEFESGGFTLSLLRNYLNPEEPDYKEEMRTLPAIGYNILSQQRKKRATEKNFLGHIPLEQAKYDRIESLLKNFPFEKYRRKAHAR